MELDELKLILDSQNQEPLYAMNEAALQRLVRRRTEEISRALSRCYLAEITIGVSCGGLMLVCAAALAFGGPAWAVAWIKVTWTFWDTLALLLASGLWFHYSAYMFLARQRQLQHNGVFEQTLRGDLDRALAQNEFQSMMAKKIVWWGLIPLWVAGALWVATIIHLVEAPAWTYVYMGATIVGSLVAVVAGKQRAITCRYEPRRRELESVRTQLIDPQL